MRINVRLIDRVALVGIFVFVIYFSIYLLVDALVSANVFQYNYLSNSIYSSSIVNAGISILLALYILVTRRHAGFIRVALMGAIFLASPLRALFLIDLVSITGFPYMNLIYDIAVISISAFLLFFFGRKEGKEAVGFGFIFLFYIYVFLVSIAVPFRDFLVTSYTLLPISFGSYLHYGFYDYITALYGIFLGLIGLRMIYVVMMHKDDIDEKIGKLGDLVKSGDLKGAASLGKQLIPQLDGERGRTVRALTAYALYKLGKASEAYDIIKDVEGEEGLKGDICLALKKFDEAKMHYERAVEVDPRDQTSLINLGKIYAEEGKMAEAEVYWRDALRISKKNPVVWRNLSALEIVRGRSEAALDLLKEAEKHVKA